MSVGPGEIEISVKRFILFFKRYSSKKVKFVAIKPLFCKENISINSNQNIYSEA